MVEAVWVPVAVDPRVPPARFGALLVEQRRQQGIEIVEMARRSQGAFTAKELDDAEKGRVAFDVATLQMLAGLYEMDAQPVIPTRNQLVLDIDSQELRVGQNVVGFESLHADDVLERYVEMVYAMRGLHEGADLVLRDTDLGVLGAGLGRTEVELRSDIYKLIAAPESVQRAKAVGKGRIALTGGVLAVLAAVGAIVLGGGPNFGSDAEVLGTQQTFVPANPFAVLGSQAEDTVGYDFRTALPEWTIRYADDHPDFLGVTRSENKTITVHIEPEATADAVAEVLMHEVGHAIDLERLDDDERAEWVELRNIPAVWWPGNGLNDFAVGAGDFAEAVSAYTTGSASNSEYGEFTPEQLAFVAAVLASE